MCNRRLSARWRSTWWQSRRGRPAIEAQILGSLGHGSNATSILPNPFNLAPRCHRNSLPFGPYDRAWRFAFHESFSGSPLCRSLLTRPGCRRRAPPSAAATLARRSVRRALSQFPKCQITALKATSSAGHEGCSQLPSDVHTLDTHPAHSESNSVPGGSDQVSSTTVDARVSQQWQCLEENMLYKRILKPGERPPKGAAFPTLLSNVTIEFNMETALGDPVLTHGQILNTTMLQFPLVSVRTSVQ
eukprot:GHVT01080268.1.p1 GENE.GHVT01080268.1~~GHVT01080268.1.p1  ORF type:complete len:245 (+),score=23.13 GHVT01080268.1:942-1676(+)